MDNQISRIFFLQITLFIMFILLVSLLGGILLLQNRVHYQESQNFLHQLESAANRLNFQLLMADEQINALGSRTMIRLKLHQWYQEEISLDELRDFTIPKFSEGASVYKDLIYAARYDHQMNMIAAFGSLPSLEIDLNTQDRYSFVHSTNGCNVLIKNPIYQDNEEVGFDFAVFYFQELFQQDYPSLLDYHVVSIPIESFDLDRGEFTYPIGDSGFYLFSRLNPEVYKAAFKQFLPITLFFSIAFMIIVIVVSYFTVLRMNVKMLKELKASHKKMLQQERYSAIGQVTAGIAHDFNNFFTGIMGYTEIIMDTEPLSEGGKRWLDTILQSCESGAALVSQLVDYTRSKGLKSQEINLAHWEELALVDPVQYKQLNWEFYIEDPALNIQFDPDLLKQIIHNLVQNALDNESTAIKIYLHRQKKSKTLLCSACHEQLDISQWIVLTIEDNGTGIPGPVKDRVFEPFITSKTLGAGMGLAQVNGILRQYGCHIQLLSNSPRGTRVQIFFPPYSLYSSATSSE